MEQRTGKRSVKCGHVNSSHTLKGGASLLLHHCYAVIALWHRGAFCGNFQFLRHCIEVIRHSEAVFGVFPPYYSNAYISTFTPHSYQPRTNYGTGVMRNQSSVALSADRIIP
ncbi:MAG: hypothetical protein ABR985_04325 [Methanotrichaceae archaeon]